MNPRLDIVDGTRRIDDLAAFRLRLRDLQKSVAQPLMKCEPFALEAVLRSIGAGLGPLKSLCRIDIEDERQRRPRRTDDGASSASSSFMSQPPA